MEKNAAEIVELPYRCTIKVHRLICLELGKFIDRISEIYSVIEAARPRCVSGLQALCSLQHTMDRANILIQSCSESSKFYLAIRKESTVLKCEKIRNALELYLSEIQKSVPTLLAAKIFGIVHDLRAATFSLESAEEEAGEAIRALLLQDIPVSNSMNNLELEAVQLAALKLEITSPLAVLIEERSIRKLLDKVSGTEFRKKKILKYLFYLLRKYRKIIGQYQKVTLEQHGKPEQSAENTLGETQADDSGISELPEEFKCPMSMRPMYDPVLIASGRTFERFWIDRWFDEGNKTCPITHMVLDNLDLTPNSALKGLISKWSSKQGVTIPDPCLEAHLSSFSYLKSQLSSSTSSFGSSMDKLRLQVSNVSLASSGTNYASEMSVGKSDGSFSCRLSQRNLKPQIIDHSAVCFSDSLGSLSGLSALSWGFQCKTVGDVKNQLQCVNHAYQYAISDNCIKPLIKFLNDAKELSDVKAQRDGTELLLAILEANRTENSPLDEEEIFVLASYLDSDNIGEALSIIEVLSSQSIYKSMMVASGVLPSILKVLDTKIIALHSVAMKILYNLSSNGDLGYHVVYLDCIPNLVPFLDDPKLPQLCMKIIKNICTSEEVSIAVAETSSFASALAKLLENGREEEQEHAADLLRSICDASAGCCQLVMTETIIQSLVNLSVNGNSGVKEIAFELLQILGRIKDQSSECSIPKTSSGQEIIPEPVNCPKAKKSSYFKAFRLFARKISHHSNRRY